mmetsp:Transcript_25677/g.37822  ORF Transcript_25677/g.37822 Transcript_25677/m.37822 type:complete len:210 (+) Transcript_25677:2409-3038(+)
MQIVTNSLANAQSSTSPPQHVAIHNSIIQLRPSTSKSPHVKRLAKVRHTFRRCGRIRVHSLRNTTEFIGEGFLRLSILTECSLRQKQQFVETHSIGMFRVFQLLLGSPCTGSSVQLHGCFGMCLSNRQIVQTEHRFELIQLSNLLRLSVWVLHHGDQVRLVNIRTNIHEILLVGNTVINLDLFYLLRQFGITKQSVMIEQYLCQCGFGG